MGENSKEREPLVTEQWVLRLRDRLYDVPLTQFTTPMDSHRLVAIAMLVTVASHQMLSDMGRSADVYSELSDAAIRFGSEISPSEGEPPSLAEMSLVMEVVTTAYSMIEARRVAVGITEVDVPTKAIAKCLLQLMQQACDAGGQKASGSLLPLLRPFANCTALLQAIP